ncbi:transposase [Nostoc punctiforme FACHB-252]|uniref:Transposase n=1 Tax=Nostoc punctiforme FACHB-252 TaxID=1357509 RepID=A0ABR8HL12_NOSPU|nr:transposase [Nostoc punctiforme]MBD2616051.1 transposase [Nostoc punctiforme FACHB-252]
MKEYSGLNSWIAIVSQKLPHLSQPQAKVLAMWSFGMAMMQSTGLTTVAVFLAELLGEKENTVRQRLREWLRDAGDKKGSHRQEIDVTKCFAPLLNWIVQQWHSQQGQLALGMDATTLGNRFTVLAISVLIRGCAVPVAWKVVKANQPGAWKPYWLELLEHLKDSVPKQMTVIVTADRGLYADWLYAKIMELGWHPFLRINLGGQFRPVDFSDWIPVSDAVPFLGSSWCGVVWCFKSNPINCTLLARHEVGYTDPWLILTDFPPLEASAIWYGMRFSATQDVQHSSDCSDRLIHILIQQRPENYIPHSYILISNPQSYKQNDP